MKKIFQVQVHHDEQAAVWVAVCDDLPVTTEASSYEELITRFDAIAPEIALENGLVRVGETLYTEFVMPHTEMVTV
jgi:hypothetical protein